MSAPSTTEPEFPLLCDACLGPSSNIRMSRRENGAACKVCERPFTVYRWNPSGAKYKKTEICSTCAKIKDCCQSCLFDLKYNVPIQVRDKYMDNSGDAIKVPQSAENQAKLAQRVENRQDVQTAIDSLYNKPASAKSNNNAILERLNRRDNSERTKARVCTFWLRGACERGDLCPFRHENPHKDAHVSAKQDIKSRYFGQNDVLAEKMINRAEKLITQHGGKDQLSKKLTLPPPPDDPEITTLYLDLNPIFAPKDPQLAGKYNKSDAVEALCDKFAAFGTPTVRVIARERPQGQEEQPDDLTKPPSSFALISFETREQAENAISTVFEGFGLFDENVPCRLGWSKKAQSKFDQQQAFIRSNHQSVPAPMGIGQHGDAAHIINSQFHHQDDNTMMMAMMAMMSQQQPYTFQNPLSQAGVSLPHPPAPPPRPPSPR